MPIIADIVLESILKSTLKRQIPYLIGGTITGAIITYYQGFLFSIIVNSVAWFAISTVVNKYYWNYTGFKDEMYLVSKYITKRQKNRPKEDQETNHVDHKDKEGTNGIDMDSSTISAESGNTKNVGSPLKFR
ncbi:MAG TPA: hypothetical protein VER14_03690 [Phototrophicaceae bacterium]|nr:hypothetical protein [Phototrophicaceae bacterium]